VAWTLSAKREPAAMTVSSGESWLSRMGHEELRELFDRGYGRHGERITATEYKKIEDRAHHFFCFV
jgi:hypothetical protein